MNRTVRAVLVFAACCLVFSSTATRAQQQAQPNDAEPVAKRADIYCTGFISELPPRTDLQIVGSEKENIKSLFSLGDVVYLNKGREAGLYPGALYYVIRPVGKVRHPFTKKKLGYFVRELGMVRVMEVQDRTATAEVAVSCDMITFGDSLRAFEAQTAPGLADEKPLPRYGEGSGGTTGQIVMSPMFHEFLATNRIVYIDLGHRQGIRPGETFTIFRRVNRREGITKFRDDDVAAHGSGGFGSDRYRGGDIAIESTPRSIPDVLASRPVMPRKVLGEMVILKVENTASVAMITRSVAEVNVGDFVERAN
jgi:hypothetical protein